MPDPQHPSLAAITDALVDSYGADGAASRVGELFLPSHDKIVSILQALRELLFPGYFGHQRLTPDNVRFHVGDLLAWVGEELAEQVRFCFRMDRRGDGRPEPPDLDQTARSVAQRLLARLPHVRAALALDAQAAYDGDPAAKSIDEIIYCYPGFLAVTTYRIAHELFELDVPLMPRIMTEHAHSITGADIHPGARIGSRFFIDHATGVVIGETTEIGDNVKIYQGVTLGAKSFPKDERGRVIKGLKRHPTIGANVTIYPNATILGGDTLIGDGVTVGGNVYVMDSVEEHSLVKQEEPRLQVLPKRSQPDR